MLDPRRSRKRAKSSMGHMVQSKNRVRFAPREIVEINGETKPAHQVEGVVFEPRGNVDGSIVATLELLHKLVRFFVYQRFDLLQS